MDVPQANRIPVAVVLNSFDAGGTEHQMTELICRLDPSLFEVHAVCLGDRGAFRDRIARASIPITEFSVRGLASGRTARQVTRFANWCRRHQIRVVHACDFYANVFSLPGAVLARVPLRIGSRRDIAIPERSWAQHRVQRFCYSLAHRVVANSTAALDRLLEEGVPISKVVHIANGLDLDRFEGGARPAGRTVVTTVANLRPGKGHEILLAAAQHVTRRRPDVMFRIAGDGPLRTSLEQTVMRLGLTGHVEFIGHQVDVPAILRHSTVFAFPSLMEASPNALLEAMASALPIVATRAGGIPEVIEHARSGLLVPPGDAEALSAAILQLLEQPDLAARLGRAARATAGSRFSFDRMTREFQTLYLRELAARAMPEGLAGLPSSRA